MKQVVIWSAGHNNAEKALLAGRNQGPADLPCLSCPVFNDTGTGD